jgi:glycogen(starch) synthase
MKVLMTADTVGGVWTYALELCAALPDVQFVVATLGALPSDAQRTEAARLPNLELEPRECLLEWMPGFTGDDGTAGWLLGLAARHRPQLVHVNGYLHALLEWDVPVIVVAHSCVISWWRAVHGCDAPPQWNDYRANVAAAFARADAVVAPTETHLRDAVALHGKPRRAFAIYNARQLSRSTAAIARDRVVLGAGRLWDHAKNIATLDRAAQELDAPVYLAGETRAPGGGGSELRAAHPLGALSPQSLRHWMERAAVFAAPAVYEPFGLAPLEAALSGCALVLGDIPSLRELWQGAALFVPPRNSDALRDALRTLLADTATRESMAARAQRRARLYSPQRMAVGYRAVYRELAPDSLQDIHEEAVA